MTLKQYSPRFKIGQQVKFKSNLSHLRDNYGLRGIPWSVVLKYLNRKCEITGIFATRESDNRKIFIGFHFYQVKPDRSSWDWPEECFELLDLNEIYASVF